VRLAPALIALALLAGCHRPRADQPSPGADSDAQAATANKTIADLQAAEDASRGPVPEIAPVVHREEVEEKVAAKAEAAPADDAATVTTSEGNQATPPQ
jgi:hypothetical protein